MSREHQPEPDSLASLERALASIVPAPPRLDRDRLLFLAGAASAAAATADAAVTLPAMPRTGARGGLLWPAATALLAGTSLALAIALVARPASEPQVQIVYRDRAVLPAAVAPAEPQPPRSPPLEPPRVATTAEHRGHIAPGSYVRTRDVALRLGLDALGSSPSIGGPQPASVPTYRQLLEVLLPPTPQSGDAPAGPHSHM